MLGRYCAGTAGAEHLRVGPLGSYIDGFATRLAREGYTPSTVQEKLHYVVHLSRWLERRKLQAADLDEERLGLFLRHRRRWGAWGSHAPTSWQLLSYLRGLGCIPTPAERIDDTPLSRIERDFERFLSSERGLKPVTLVGYLRPVRRFLLERFGREDPRLDQLCPRDINRFILQRTQGVRRSYAKLMVTALRSFLLGHESVETTSMYLHADPKLKEQALARTVGTSVRARRYRPDDRVMAFLRSL